ncbi:hypothetical protein Tco_0975701 [Tanacetum coccineum]|uniref:Uncharacterized protein n=1 Tax=Tanacetum coccineum TaxID=301880 RepID=A0ABQ5EF51_9ASTR
MAEIGCNWARIGPSKSSQSLSIAHKWAVGDGVDVAVVVLAVAVGGDGGVGIGGSDGVMMIIMGVRWRWCYGGGDRVARGGECIVNDLKIRNVETEPEPFEHIFEEPSPVHQPSSPPQEQAQGQMAMDDLLQVVPKLISRIDSLETDLKQTKLTMGNAIVKLVKKVKKLEGLLKKRHVVLSDSEEEEPEAQGRKSQDDPLASSVQGLVTPSTTKVKASGEEQVEDISPNTLEAAKTLSKASGEEQVEDISPNTLEAAKTLSKVASLKPRSIDKGRRYKRRKEAKGKKVVSSLDFQEEVDTGAEQVNTAEGVNTGSIKLSTVSEQLSTGSEQVSTVSAKKSTSSVDKGQREGKAPMISEETPKKLNNKILHEEASLAEAIRLDSLQKEEEAKQVHLDSLLAQRIAEEEELNEQQKKRKAQVQFEVNIYTMKIGIKLEPKIALM